MKESLDDDVRKLRGLTTKPEHEQSLSRLKDAAKTGVSMKWWGRRILFGLNFADSIENWLNAFDPKLDNPLKQQIPIIETKEVAAAWMKFSFRRSIILFLMSAFITLITAYFLWGQIKKQDELIRVQTIKNDLEQRFLYMHVLYDEICKDHQTEKEECKPAYNHRQRTDAVFNLSKTEKNLAQSRLDDTNLSLIDLTDTLLAQANLNNAYFHDANLNNANLSNADLRGATFIKVDLSHAILVNAKLEGASFINVDLKDAALGDVNLKALKTFKADLKGAQYKKSTIFPDGFDPEKEGMILVDEHFSVSRHYMDFSFRSFLEEIWNKLFLD